VLKGDGWRRKEEREREGEKRCSLHPMCRELLCAPTAVLCFVYCSRERERETVRERDRMDALWRMQIEYSRRSCGLCFAPTSHMLLKDTVSATILFYKPAYFTHAVDSLHKELQIKCPIFMVTLLRWSLSVLHFKR